MSGTLAEHNDASQFWQYTKPGSAAQGKTRRDGGIINDANHVPANKGRTPRFMSPPRTELVHKPRVQKTQVFGTPAWKRKSHAHHSALPLAVHGKKNGRDFYKPHDSCAPKSIDSRFLGQFHELDPRAAVSEESEEPPYPLNRSHDYMKHRVSSAKPSKHKDWHGHIVQPELYSASANPLRMDSTTVPPCPRGPQEERLFPGNCINRDFTQAEQIVQKVSEGLIPHCFRHTDSMLSSKYSLGWKKTPYEVTGLQKDGLQENMDMKTQLKWLDPKKFEEHFKKNPDTYGRRSEPGLLPQGASNFDSSSLSKYDITKYKERAAKARRTSYSHSFERNPAKQMCGRQEMIGTPGAIAKARRKQMLHGGAKPRSDESVAFIETISKSRAQTPAF